MKNKTLKEDLEDPSGMSRAVKKKIRVDARGAFQSWCRSLLGDYSLVLAVLKHGIFDFSDLSRCAQFLRSEPKSAGAAQPARDLELRRQALRAPRDVKLAQKWQQWHAQGWRLKQWQQKQVILLETGRLEEILRESKAPDQFGRSAKTSITKAQAMTLQVFTSEALQDYFQP